MKKRGEVDEEEEKDIYIGDEPDDGPTHYIMLAGFNDVNLCPLLAEQGVEVVSIIQIKQEQPNQEDIYPFWGELNTIFKRGLKDHLVGNL